MEYTEGVAYRANEDGAGKLILNIDVEGMLFLIYYNTIYKKCKIYIKQILETKNIF